ncbi:MAG: BMP family ABC transporter substrate-binding protein, partial [Ruthenibacterium sp.]
MSITKKSHFEIAFVLPVGNANDTAFADGCWKSIQEFAQNHYCNCRCYSPKKCAVYEQLQTIALAVYNKADIIIALGSRMGVPLYTAQKIYPNVKFVLIGGIPNNPDSNESLIGSNIVCIDYAEEQSGFLAGYATVTDGKRRLCFLGGMKFSSVIRFGHGFVQGAQYAAQELKLLKNETMLYYTYTGLIDASEQVERLASDMYCGGVEIIFGCGGSIGNSVIKAAEKSGRSSYAIGVDVDQSSASHTIFTSACKNLS